LPGSGFSGPATFSALSGPAVFLGFPDSSFFGLPDLSAFWLC
jgi:hypothetical protein